jgi:two-component system, NarL family, response regulator DegU
MPTMHIPISQPIRVVIADDHPVMRLGLDHLIQSQVGMEVMGAVGTGAEALALVQQAQPDVLILDVDMPGMDGLELMYLLRDTVESLSIIIFTAHHDENTFNLAISAGVAGFISKENVFDDLIEGIRSVAMGRNYFSPVFSSFLLKRIQSGDEQQNRHLEKEKLENLLTLMEQRIIRLVAEGKSSSDIADQIFISAKTVDNHRTNICKKLNLHGKNSLLKFALEHKHLWNDLK